MKKYAIVTDFDGTVTTLDIGNSLCLHFGTTTQEKIEHAYAVKADAKTWMECHFGPIKVKQQEFERVILDIAALKDGFIKLAEFCKKHNVPFEIASGGLDIYINPILKKNNVPAIPVYCVQGTFTADGIMIDFPFYPDMPLEVFKASRVKYYKAQGYTTIFLGDGPSDFNAAKEADIVFATDRLVDICKQNNVAFNEFKDFNAALKILEENYVTVPA